MRERPDRIDAKDRVFTAVIAHGKFCGHKDGRWVTLDAQTTMDREDVIMLRDVLQDWLDGTEAS